jgi:hypothetical protein
MNVWNVTSVVWLVPQQYIYTCNNKFVSPINDGKKRNKEKEERY